MCVCVCVNVRVCESCFDVCGILWVGCALGVVVCAWVAEGVLWLLWRRIPKLLEVLLLVRLKLSESKSDITL